MGGIPSCAGSGGVPAPPGALDEMDLLSLSEQGRKLAPAAAARRTSSERVSEAVWYPLVVPAARFRVPRSDPGKEKAAASSGFSNGSDGTRTRDLRRDRRNSRAAAPR